MNAIDVNITSNKVEACHRLGEKKENAIVRVIDRKHCLKVLRSKKKLNSIDIANLFIYKSKFNSKLAFNCRKLKRDGEIKKCYTINGTAHIAKQIK